MTSRTVSISTRKRCRNATCTSLWIIFFCRYAPKPLTNRFPLESLYALHLAARAIRPSRLLIFPELPLPCLLRAGKLQEQAPVTGNALSGLQAAHHLCLAITALA